VGVSLFSLHYLAFGSRFAPPGIGESFDARPIIFLSHIVGGIVAMATGIWQFLPRTRKSSWHRTAGKAYVIACIVGGIGGIGVAPYATGGIVSATGFATLGVLWILATLKGYAAIQKRDIPRHRIWMWRSYGLTCAAITLRIIVPVGTAAGVPFEVLYPPTAWACWITSLGAAELLRRWIDRPKATPTVAGMA
jgi:uncharacterized membrane protein